MSASLEWSDFVIYPQAPDFVRDRDSRLRTEGAANIKEFKPGMQTCLIDRSYIERDGDEFQALRIDDIGNVLIWTRHKVWFLRREFNHEKLMQVPRNPVEA